MVYFIWLNYLLGVAIVNFEGYFRSGELRWVWEVMQEIKLISLLLLFASIFFPVGVLLYKGADFAKQHSLWLILGSLPSLILFYRIWLSF